MTTMIWNDEQAMAKEIESIIGGNTKKMVEVAKKLGERWGKELDSQRSGGTERNDERLTKSQIRNVFGSVKRMEMQGFQEKEFLLLKPKLAYAAKRPGAKKGTRELEEVLSAAIEVVGSDKSKFENFCDFFEAILAYHRAADGK